MKYNYILFDLDGTLTDPAVGICSCVQYALDKGGYKSESLEKYYPWIGPPLIDSFKQYLEVSDDEANRLLSYYRERFSTIGLYENKVYPQIPKLLATLKESGATLAVATGKPTVYSKQILEHFNLIQYFDFVSGINLNSECTDKGTVISIAMQKLNAPVSDCIMIGDRIHDIEGARGNKIDSIYVLYGYGGKEEAIKSGATFIVNSIKDLRNILLA